MKSATDPILSSSFGGKGRRRIKVLQNFKFVDSSRISSVKLKVLNIVRFGNKSNLRDSCPLDLPVHIDKQSVFLVLRLAINIVLFVHVKSIKLLLVSSRIRILLTSTFPHSLCPFYVTGQLA